jgi:dipeptidyl aminopeptidase/acylaminoacyl peptidase
MIRSAPEHRDVRFPAGDGRCHAWLYLPATDDETPPPVIVMAHGLGAVKALRLDAFARRFQAEGYACLVFDYRHFGDSEGQPRELLSIRRQRQDWHAAVAFARSLPEVDAQRVVLWEPPSRAGTPSPPPPRTPASSPPLPNAPSPTGSPRRWCCRRAPPRG